MTSGNLPAARPTRLAAAIALALLAAASFGALAADGAPHGPPGPTAPPANVRTVVTGDGWIVDRTTTLAVLRLEPGAAITAPPGRSLTLTVDGVQRDLLPGTYRGQVVLSVTDGVPIKFNDAMTHNFRQALYLDQSGVVSSKSVEAAAGNFALKDGVLTGANIHSNGANFNGVLVTGGSYTLRDLKLDFEGNGGNDFAGYGAGVMSMGKGTTLILDGAHVATHGAVRTTVIGNTGSNLIVKNSDISSKTGTLPSDYVSNVTPGEMKDAPWMLGIKGNVRSTNVLGDDTTCTYINTRLFSDGWGVLSIDMSRNTRLTTINSTVDLAGEAGYGSYAIGNSTNSFYGTTMRVPTHGVIITGGHAVFASSSRANVDRLDAELKLHLTDAEKVALEPRQTVVESKRFGVMIWGDATVKIADGTVFRTGEAVFLDKAATTSIDVDGSGGARLEPRNGVIFQGINSDDPGPRMRDGLMVNDGVYRDPPALPKRIADFDLAGEHKTDMLATFRNIALKGDFFNAVREIPVGGGMDSDGGMHPPTGVSGQNLVLGFDDSQVTGRITASNARHVKPVITAADFQALGEVVNTPASAINNGVLVTLHHSTWTVTGTSYLTRLVVDEASAVRAAKGKVTMTVDGVATPIKAGSYHGDIVLRAGA